MTSNPISASLRQLVIKRAQGRCEYCLIHQDVSIEQWQRVQELLDVK